MEQIAESNRLLARTWLGSGKLFMAGITPYYRGLGGNYRVYDSNGFEGMALQWEGDPAEIVPLLGLWRPGAAPRLCEARPEEAALMKGYAGSVAFGGDGTRVGITSPKGGAVMVFDAAGGWP